MQGQGRKTVQTAGRKIVRIHQVDSRPASSRGVEGRLIRRHGNNCEALPGQEAEVLRCLGVELLRDVSRTHQELFRYLGVELRIGPEELEESGETTVETSLL